MSQQVSKGKCNICGYPAVVSYTDTDEETGKRVTKTHIVQCLGHLGIHPSLWNKAYGGSSNGIKTPGFQDFEKARLSNQEGRKYAKLQRKKKNRNRKEKVNRG